MKKRLQVVIPMSGVGERFRRAGYTLPKPLIEVAGKPIITHLVERFPKDSAFVFICNEQHLQTTPLRKTLESLRVECSIVSIAPHKLGPVHAVLEASAHVQRDLPTVVNYCDFSFRWDAEHFLEWTRRMDIDGAVVCYRGFHPHYFSSTNYAYCRTDGDGNILEVREKENFTADRTQEFASSGTYFFRSGQITLDYFARTKEAGSQYNGEFYVSLVYNHLIKDGRAVKVYEIEQFCQWGTPEDLEDWVYWERCLDPRKARRVFRSGSSAKRTALLMPMAGLGSRFGAEFPPKPLIPVHGQPMFLSAAESFPPEAQRIFVTREKIAAEVTPVLRPTDSCVTLSDSTDGQATTCFAALPALSKLPPDTSLWVSACDHGLALSMEQIRELNCDVAVVGVRGYPGARRSPNSYGYLEAEHRNLAQIRRVSVKAPVSATPQRDWVLIGTFYFRSVALFTSLLEKLLQRRLFTNGERYLDSIVSVALEEKMDTRVLETSAYFGWGTPEALQEYQYWYAYFCGRLQV